MPAPRTRAASPSWPPNWASASTPSRFGPKDLTDADDGERGVVDAATLRADGRAQRRREPSACAPPRTWSRSTEALDRLEATDGDGLAAEVFRDLWIWPAALAGLLWHRSRPGGVPNEPTSDAPAAVLAARAAASRRRPRLAGPARRRAGRVGQGGAIPHLMAALRALGRVDGGRRFGAVARPAGAPRLIALALAGPAVERRGAAAFRNLDGVDPGPRCLAFGHGGRRTGPIRRPSPGIAAAALGSAAGGAGRLRGRRLCRLAT